jgi:DNA (cytosine-5)-methyltransferase 1
MNVLDLFSGIGGFSLGLERAGMRTVAFCEIDKFCREVLAKHWPDVPCYEDVTTADFPAADIVVGGFPCQDVSLAGRRAGITGERSGLYRELIRALRVVRPRHAIVENVAALLGDGLDLVLGDMAESGLDAEWDCVPACAIGAPHERDRIWIVAHANGFHGWRGAGWQDGPQAGDGADAKAPARDVADIAREQVGIAGQPRQHERVGSTHPDAESERRGSWWPRRPPDSFAGVRVEARRNAADPYGARLAFRSGLTRDAWEKLAPAERDSLSNGGQSVWPDEPALSGVDDGIPDWMDRVKTTGNTVLPQIPEIIGRTIIEAKRTQLAK